MALRSYNVWAAPLLVGADQSATQYHGLKMDTSSEYDVDPVASQYDMPLGVQLDDPDADGEPVEVAKIEPGAILPIEVGTAGVSAGDYVRFDSAAELATCNSGHPMCIGRVFKAWTDGQIAEVFCHRTPGDSSELITRKFQYDFADLGGAAGAITLTDDEDAALTVPDNAVILRAYLEALTTATSGGAATIALGFTGITTALIAATAYNNGEFDADTQTELTAAIPDKTTAALSCLATVATADLTAGKFNIWVEYVVGD